MNRNIRLWPPLEVVERAHIGLSDSILQRAAEGDLPADLMQVIKEHEDTRNHLPESESIEGSPEATADTVSGNIPAGIQALIERRVSACETAFGTPPQPGQIVRVSRLPEGHEQRLGAILGSPLYVLLEGVDDEVDPEGNVWYGWLCAAETDYASWWDWVLQEEDGSCDPEAGMVQIWNPVYVPAGAIESVVGELEPGRLAAARALAKEYLLRPGSDVMPNPGRVGMRTTLNDLLVVTGSPLDEDGQDPRHRYQEIYFEAAEALRHSSRLLLADATAMVADDKTVNWGDWLRSLTDTLGDMLFPQAAVPVAMAEGSSGDIPDLHWDAGDARLHLETGDAGAPAVLLVANQGGSSLEIKLLREGDRLILDQWRVETHSEKRIELDDPELAVIVLEKAGIAALELPLPN